MKNAHASGSNSLRSFLKEFVVVAACLVASPLNAAERAIEKEAVISAGINAVWQAWTTEEGVKSFFAPAARVKLEVDGPFEIYINPFAKPGLKGADDMRILAFQERKLLSFTWNAPPHLPEVRKQRTVVIVRFEPQGEAKTLVKLSHVGWGEGEEWERAYQYFSRAWGNVLTNLENRFVKGPVDWSSWLEQLKKTSQ